MADKIHEILSSWGASRNVLLYGPPATGKTRLISDLFETLKQPVQGSKGILLDVANPDTPFSRPAQEITIPQPVKVIWTTFHQSYGYEDFVLGLRPEITADGTHLQPWAGVFLDAALELVDPNSSYKSVVIFIDEINRGNAARIFGEFMTFLDFDYREGGRVPLPLPLRQLHYENGVSELIRRPGAQAAKIPAGFTFPKDIYIVATMNSVDRAAVPIDSALARRFDRIEMRPNLDVLAEHWGLDKKEIPKPVDKKWEDLSPFETAYLLLDKLNVSIASDLGPEFELGHGLFKPLLNPTHIGVSEDDIWLTLSKIWDDVVFPQLEDRYSGRPDQLLALLRVEDSPTVGRYAWTLRIAKGNGVASQTLSPVRVSMLNIDDIKRSFRWLSQ